MKPQAKMKISSIYNKFSAMLKSLFNSTTNAELELPDGFDNMWRAYFKEKPTLEEYYNVKGRPEDEIRYILSFYHSGASEPVKYSSLKKFSEYLDKIDNSEYHY